MDYDADNVKVRLLDVGQLPCGEYKVSIESISIEENEITLWVKPIREKTNE